MENANKKRKTSHVSESTVGNSTTVAKGKKYSRGKYSKTKGLSKYIKAVIKGNAEKKEVLTSLASTLNATQSNVILVSGMAQGTTGITRVGLEVSHSYLEVDLLISNGSSSNTTGPFVGDGGFWAIVLDRQPNGGLATFATMFDDSLAVGQGTDFRITTTYQDRFKILSRNEWSVGCSVANPAGTVTFSGAAPYHVKEFIDLSKLKGNDQSENFSGSSAAIGSIDSGALLFVVASSTSDADNITGVIGQCKYRFTDV